jgi:penicillin-binding protein 2
VPGVKVWGKTGTAQTPPLAIDPDGKEGPAQPAIAREGDHSWFVVLAGEEEPEYAVAVITEFGGGGGKVSGPICNQILHAMAHEGYLQPSE